MAPGASSCRVLVIEDEYIIADDLRCALEQAGATVLGPFGDLSTAVEQVRLDGFDVAAVDVNLHGEKAYCIGDELRRQEIPFVFTTGYCESAIPTRFCDIPRWQKPYDVSALVHQLSSLGRRSGPTASLR